MTYYFSHFPFVSNFIILRNLAQKGRKILPMHHTGRAKSQGGLNFLFLTFSCFIFEREKTGDQTSDPPSRCVHLQHRRGHWG